MRMLDIYEAISEYMTIEIVTIYERLFEEYLIRDFVTKWLQKFCNFLLEKKYL